MIEIIVIVALLIFIGWKEYQTRLERAKYLNAILGKNTQEIVSLNLSDKPSEPEPVVESPVAENDLPDEDFLKQIKKTNG